MPALDDADGDGRDLLGRLAEAQDHFGESLANRAVMVDAGEPEVLERLVAQVGEQRACARPAALTSPAPTASSRARSSAGVMPLSPLFR